MDEYIEREAVHDLVRSLTKYAWTSPDNTGHRVTVDADDVNFGVDKIPYADVAPVRHGRWVHEHISEGYAWVMCSECEAVIHKILIRKRLNYCPNCGAKMDGAD